MIIVTGGAGFIGSNLVRGLNDRGEDDILVVDDLTDGHKFRNLAPLKIADYWDRSELEQRIANDSLGFKPRAILHQGACATTTEWDGAYMMRNNFTYSKHLLDYCEDESVPLIYASSAAVYGSGPDFVERPEAEAPLNVYGYSKLLFDQLVRRRNPSCQVVGLRYFNVYGPGEAHKGSMASIAYHLGQQIEADGEARLFEGSDGYEAGEQRRDFIHVDDVVAVNLFFLDNAGKRGIFNVGTGRSQTFNEVAQAAIAARGRGQVRYIPFPEHLKGAYQSYTQADITSLRDAGFAADFLDVAAGVRRYLS